MAIREYAGAAKRTALSGDITAASTTITVADATGYPTGATGPFAIALSQGQAAEEKILVTSRSGNTLTINTRGYDGTTASNHSSGATIDHVLTAIDVREANEHINKTTAAHAASAISYAGSTDLVATTVEAALDELDSKKLSTTAASAAYGHWTRIGEVTINPDGAATFTAIPATYRHLRLEILARSTLAASLDDALLLRLNADTGANYDFSTLILAGTVVSGAEDYAATFIRLGRIAAASAPAGVASPVVVDIPDYARTTWQKAVNAQAGVKTGTAAGSLGARRTAGFWRSTAAVTEVSVLAQNGLLATGSVVTLYGMKGL